MGWKKNLARTMELALLAQGDAIKVLKEEVAALRRQNAELVNALLVREKIEYKLSDPTERTYHDEASFSPDLTSEDLAGEVVDVDEDDPRHRV